MNTITHHMTICTFSIFFSILDLATIAVLHVGWQTSCWLGA